ncbi:MAG: alpha-E domain-containing protein [Kofleriaceae bacterium]
MLSRVADAIYWMNRYVERAESVARFVDVNLHLSLDLPRGTSADWSPIIATTGDDELFRSRHGAPARDTAMRFLTFDREYPSSLLRCLEAARENARSVREVISSEMWERLNSLYLTVREARPDEVLAAPHDFFTAVKQGAALFIGTTYLTMSHNEAWHFGKLGRLVERADKTSRIVDVKCYDLTKPLVGAVDDIQWGALLKSASALEMYRKRYGRITPAHVVKFLLFDRDFPRSMWHCLYGASESLRAIVRRPDSGATHVRAQLGGAAQLQSMQALSGPAPTLAELRVEALLDELERHATDVGALLGSQLHAVLDNAQVRLNELGHAIRDTFFSPD